MSNNKYVQSLITGSNESRIEQFRAANRNLNPISLNKCTPDRAIEYVRLAAVAVPFSAAATDKLQEYCSVERPPNWLFCIMQLALQQAYVEGSEGVGETEVVYAFERMSKIERFQMDAINDTK